MARPPKRLQQTDPAGTNREPRPVAADPTPKPRQSPPGTPGPSGSKRRTVGDINPPPVKTEKDGKTPVLTPKDLPISAPEETPTEIAHPLTRRAGPPAVAGTPPKTVEKKIVTVKLFSSLHEGVGDADATPIHSTKDGSTRYNRIHGSIDARWPGQLRMGMKLVKQATVDHDYYPVFAVHWTDTNGIDPAHFYLVGADIKKMLFGTVSNTVAGANALGAGNIATGGMFDDDGSGIPYLYACFGGVAASSAKLRRMNRAQTVTTSAAVTAGLLLSLNGKAYRTMQPVSGTAECQISVCPYGNDRFTLANWGDGVTVGFAGTSVNFLGAVRQAPVAVKPEGIFAYNAGLDQWVNYTPSWRSFFHLANGIGSYYLGDALIVAMGDGSALIFDGNNVRPFDVGGLLSTPNVHSTRDNFGFIDSVKGTMSAMQHWIIGATGGPSKEMMPSGFRAWYFTSIGATYTDMSSTLSDWNLTTEQAFTYAASDEIYIGSDHPFTSIRFDGDTGNTTARTMTVKVGTGVGAFTTLGAKNTGFRDFTEVAGAPFNKIGTIVMMVDPVQLGWVQNAVNGVTKYWVQITFSGALSVVNWSNTAISPWYPSIDATTFPLDGLDKSGVFPHILFGRTAPNGSEPWWHDVVSLPEPDSISQIIFGSTGGSGQHYSRNLVLFGRFGVWVLSTARNDRPGTDGVPYLHNVGLIESASIVPVPGKLCRLVRVRINGHEFDPALAGHLYYSWDWGKPWSRIGGNILTVPAVVENMEKSSRGYRFRWAWGWKQTAAAQALSQPTVTEIEADFEVLDLPLHETQERTLQTQPRI